MPKCEHCRRPIVGTVHRTLDDVPFCSSCIPGDGERPSAADRACATCKWVEREERDGEVLVCGSFGPCNDAEVAPDFFCSMYTHQSGAAPSPAPDGQREALEREAKEVRRVFAQATLKGRNHDYEGEESLRNKAVNMSQELINKLLAALSAEDR